jgi:hypothetical protein
MSNPESVTRPAWQRGLIVLATTLAALAGLVAGYGFGGRIGGPLVGVVLALNAAVFCSIIAGALAERCFAWWQDHSPRAGCGRMSA